ncbi:S41 family peptidase [Pseudoalteromonas sp. Ps84H-4]|uniref:S41 family peptidase n=1 Tax=Pseudoalteromonas sp. Ps84H-4 TaxID=2954502 RepID=UPI002097D6CA|nr:S41 family peptidase [Pseudoalteromonas sp. Ps84H-4]MCO7251518.1 S41 family peptidase [Pseudoalteromonas sp. Ps84H-4]
MKTLILFILTLIFLSGCKQSHLDIFPELSGERLLLQELSVAQMKADIDALLEGVIKRHPDIEEYANLAVLRAKAEQLKASLNKPLNRVEFYRVVGSLTSYFQDGHSFLIWPYQELNKLREAGHNTFPLAVSVNEKGKLQLKHAYSLGEQRIPILSEIISINGVNADLLLSQLALYAGGETALLREHAVAMRFGIALWARYGWLDNFEVQVSTPEGIKAFHFESQKKWPKVDEKAQGFVASYSDKAHYYKQLSNDVGFIYLGHFDIEPREFERFIDQTFSKIKQQNVKQLIIDIRDNPGGNTDTVTYLSRYLADKPFRLISKLKEKLNEENRGWFNNKGEVGDIVVTDWDDWESPINKAQRFDGDTFLLIGPVTYSASIVLATTLKDNGFATLVGETTGGYANQSAQGNLFNLPNSELRAYVTTRMLVRPNGELARRGVTPHYSLSDYNLNACKHVQADNAYAFTNANQQDKALRLIGLLLSGELQQCEQEVE